MAKVSELLLGKGALRHLDMKMIVLQNTKHFPNVIQVISPRLAINEDIIYEYYNTFAKKRS
jgi:hypothetical protein